MANINPPYLAGVDLGAGSLKVTIITLTGEIVAETAHPIATSIPHPGWSEQNPADWRAALLTALPAAIAAAGTPPAAIAFSAGAHIPVLTDESGAVLRPAILWSDQRAAAQSAALHAEYGDTIIATGLNRINPTWTLAMISWLATHEPEILAQTHRLYLAKDFLRAPLTDDWSTDFSDALGTLLADNATQSWSPAMAALAGIPVTKLPPIRRNVSVAGHVTESAATRFGLPAGTPVITGAIDTSTELFGLGCLQPGDSALKLATAAVLSRVTAHPHIAPPISCYPHIIDGLYYNAAGTNSCASAHRWLRDLMFESYDQMDCLAATVPPGANGLLFHPYLQGERAPLWDPDLRASFTGLTMSHGRPHIARAFHEGIAFSIRHLIESDGRPYTRLRLTGGGARSPLWRQILADITGCTMEVTQSPDASFGTALIAGIGAGLFPTPESAIASCVRLTATTAPNPATAALYTAQFALYKDAQRALTPLNHALAALP
jgi:xylulokinase